MRISDWSSDVCSSDLAPLPRISGRAPRTASRGPMAMSTPMAIAALTIRPAMAIRSEERRVGKSVSVRVDLGGRRIIKKKKNNKYIKIITIENQDVYIKYK